MARGGHMWKVLKYFFGVFVVVAFIQVLIEKNSNSVQSPQPSEASYKLPPPVVASVAEGQPQIKEEQSNKPKPSISTDETSIDHKILSALIHIKQNMKDPSSFSLVEVLSSDTGACLKYRGINSFGAKNVGSAVVVNFPGTTQYGIVLEEESRADFVKYHNKTCVKKKLENKTPEFKYMVNAI